MHDDQITVIELKRLREEGIAHIVLDVREPFEYEICHIHGKLIPLAELPHRFNELNPDDFIIVQCRSGHRSQQAAEYLRSQGFSKVQNLQGGILAWIKEIDSSLTAY